MMMILWSIFWLYNLGSQQHFWSDISQIVTILEIKKTFFIIVIRPLSPLTVIAFVIVIILMIFDFVFSDKETLHNKIEFTKNCYLISYLYLHGPPMPNYSIVLNRTVALVVTV